MLDTAAAPDGTAPDGTAPDGTAPDGTARAADPRRWFGLVALLVAEAMNLLDATIVQVAAPTMRAELGGGSSDIQWFTAAYTLPFAVLLVTGGRLGDRIGRRRIFRIGVALFTLTSAACALAPDAGWLIAFRAVQGAAAALVIPQTIGLIKSMFGGAEVSKALGTIGPVMGLAGVAGPVLGGVLTHADLFGTSWRAVFCVNLPLGLAVLAVSSFIRESRAPRQASLDPVGTLLLTTGAVLIVLALVEPGSPLRRAALIVPGLAVLGLVALQQRRRDRQGRSSLIEVSLFARPGFARALGTSTLFFAVMNGLMLVVVVHLQLSLHAGPLRAGLTLLPWSAGLGLASYLAGARLVPRFGHRVMPAGLLVLVVGVGLAVTAYAITPAARYPVAVLPALAVCGLGIGLFTPAFFTAALHGVEPQEIGSAAGLLNAVQQFGATLGVAALGSVFLARTPHGANTAAVLTFAIAGVIVLLVLVTAARGFASDR